MESLRGPQQYRPLAEAAGGTTDYDCTVPAGGTLTVSGTAQGPSGTLSVAWAATGGAAVDSQSLAKAQSVAADAVPAVFSRAAAATVSCTADGTLTLTAAAGVHKRSVTVAVACGAVSPAVACDDPLGALPDGVTSRSGTITADADCITAHRGRSGTYYTRRHTFTLGAAAQVTVELGSAASNRSRLDTYLILLEGHTGDSDATVTASNDDKDSSSTDSRIAEKLPAGDYTIEATAWGPSRTGGYKLTVDAEHDKHVKISGLAGTAKAGTGTVAVTAAFTVAPAAAKCTAMPATATITDGVGAADRSVSADIAAPGSLAVTVDCTAPGHTASTQTVTLTAKLTAGIITIGARALDGGECDTAETVPDSADVAYGCTMARGGTLRVEAEATATAATLDIAWAATGGITVDTQTQDTATAVVGPDGTALHRRTAAAAVNCTADGTATATAALGASTKTAHVTITCQPPVSIDGLDDTTAAGSGQVTVTAAFTVEPADAVCTAEPDNATVTKGQNPADRNVSAVVTAPGSLDVTVSCTKPGYAPASHEVTLKATGEVSISGFEGAEGTPDAGEAAVTLSSGFTVSPAGATCMATPSGASVTPASGGSRTVSLAVAAATTVNVTVTCTSGSHKDTATAKFKANPAPVVHDCDDPLGTLSSVKSSRTGSLGSTTGCLSVRHPRFGDGRVFYAGRHTFRMAAAGWVTIDLANTGSGSDRIDAFVLLLNGYTPDGAGTRLAHDDDSGPPDGRYNADSRIARRFLQPGMYTIEATTFGPGDQGTYRVTVTADYKPKITGTAAQAVMRVENGDTVTRKWAYTPASTRVALALVSPIVGIGTRVTADEGDATLTATPSEVGTFDVYVAHSNGGTTSSLHTKIISYCPTGQIELPGDCATPLTKLGRRSEQIIVSSHPEHIVNRAHDCFMKRRTGEPDRWICRRLQDERVYISKSSDQIVGTPEAHPDYGTILALKSDELLEGCQSITKEHWQCDYRADWLWYHDEGQGSLGSYLLDAFISGVVDPARCATFILLFWGTEGVHPQFGAGTVISCGSLFTWEDDG